MSFAVPQTSRQGQTDLPLHPRTHALGGEIAMARPRQREKRDRQMNLKFTVQERAWIDARAAKTQLEPFEYARAQVLAEKPVPTRRASPHHLDPLFLTHLSRVGNNLNQIARKMHALNIPPPPSLENLLSTVRELLMQAARDGS
jgi:hypothetical protein